MNFLKLTILTALLIGVSFAQQVRLSYELVATDAGTDVLVYAESYTESSVDVSALNLSVAYNIGCEVVDNAESMLLESWTDYLAQSADVHELKLAHSGELFSRRYQWGSADPGLPQTTALTVSPQGQRMLILTQSFTGNCDDLYLEHSSENALNQIGDAEMQPMDYVIEHPNRPTKVAPSFTLEAYPNPTTDFVTVKAEGIAAGDYRLQLTDAAGRLVQTESRSFEAGQATEVTVDLRRHADGVYILNLQSTDGSSAHALRVVKK